MKKLLLEGKEFMYAEERAKLVAEAKPWVLSMQHAPILRLAFIRELAGIARLQADDIERQYGLAGCRSLQTVLRWRPAAGARRLCPQA